MSKKHRKKEVRILNNPAVGASSINETIFSLKNDTGFGLFVLAILSLFAIVIYGNSLHNPFIWDDQYLITENHFIKSSKYILDMFKHQLYYSTAGSSNFYRPLQNLFLYFDYSLWKENPVGYHLTNILFHILSAFLIYLLIKCIFNRKAIAFLVSFLFLVHPVNSTVVNYISSRADSQSAMFTLLALFLFIKYTARSGSAAYLWISLFSFIAALLSKELAIILPFLLLFAMPLVSGPKISVLKKTIPFFIILGVYIALRATVLSFSNTLHVTSPSLYIRLSTTCESFVRLIGTLFAPLQIHIEKRLPLSKGLLDPATFASLVVWIALAVFMIRIRKHCKMCFWGLVWFFVTLIPMANIVPINTTLADHWLYIPCAGFFLSVIAAINYLIEKLAAKRLDFYKKLGLILYTGVIILFSILTIKQNTIWSSPLKFYTLATKYNPASYRGHNEIGVIYLNDYQDYDKAIMEFEKAIAINPSFDQAYDNLGVAYDHKGNLDEAIVQHKKAIELNPYNAKSFNNLGNAYNKLNRFDEAIANYQNALKLNPDYKAVYNNLGVIYYKKGMYKEAREYWEHALKIDPNFKMVQENLDILNQSESH